MLAVVVGGGAEIGLGQAALRGAGAGFAARPGDELLTEQVLGADALLLVAPVRLGGLPGDLKTWLDSLLEIRPAARRTAQTGGKPAGYLATDPPADPDARDLFHRHVCALLGYLGYVYRDGLMVDAGADAAAAAERIGAVVAGVTPGYAGYPEEYLRGIALFNAGEFWEAHEEWEAIWLEAEEGYPLFFQGLIQVAAAFHHFRNGHWPGMASLLREATAKLEGYRPGRLGLDVDALLAVLEPWARLADAGGPTANAPGAPPRLVLA